MGIFGTKAGMMSYFTEDGLCVPATVIALEEGNIVTAVKTDETDGYNAVQVHIRAGLVVWASQRGEGSKGAIAAPTMKPRR